MAPIAMARVSVSSPVPSVTGVAVDSVVIAWVSVRPTGVDSPGEDPSSGVRFGFIFGFRFDGELVSRVESVKEFVAVESVGSLDCEHFSNLSADKD